MKNCHLTLSLGDILKEFDLGQRTTLGIPVDRGFELVTRFEIRFEDLTGVELKENIERQRKQYLESPISSGDVVDTARIFKLTRREFTLSEPEFITINYATSIVAEDNISAGYFGK